MKEIAPLGKYARWAPLAWRRMTIVRFEDSRGQTKSVFVSPSMSNADRFLLELREHIARG